MVSIRQVMCTLERNGANNLVKKGSKNGGSTVLFPFGHLQYHIKRLELYKIQTLLNSFAA